jgi:ABC-type transporter Mla maintaining outer membrane lipid asymmetry ATPase subunit MlaF/ABC-type transporter Mla maintaining outer membrane lipid asymmetry permease subunit MlaE
MTIKDGEYSSLTKVELRGLCKERGIVQKGVKKDIVERLIESDAAVAAGTNPSGVASRPLLEFRARNINASMCPFTNETVSFTLHPSSCLHFSGQSGAGKTTLSNYIAGILPPQRGKNMLRNTLGIDIEVCQWDERIPEGERVGMLFQQTTLLDSLTVAGNVCVALENCPTTAKGGNNGTKNHQQTRSTIKRLLETVGLDYLRDGSKKPSQLSGGMARRASLALQLAQHKHVIVLDEPFAGLDFATAVGVAKELERIRRERGTALLLISHEPHIVDVVMGNALAAKKDGNITGDSSSSFSNSVVTLQRRENDDEKADKLQHPSLFGKDALHRFASKLLDYFIFSLPLIMLTFIASGLAIAMLSSDILRRVDVTDTVLSVVQREIKPLIQMFTGDEDVSPMYTMMINMKVKGMLNTTIPPAKATLYAMGMAKLFVLEIGPLITALLLSGRIGGSYAGEVATMQSTAQNKLLLTLGISPIAWTFVPSLFASLLASPLLTMAGTALALEIGSHVAPKYGIGDAEGYRREVWDAIFVPLRIRGFTSWSENEGWERGGKNLLESVYSFLDLRCTFSDTYFDAVIEVTTHPVFFHLIKSLTFITIIMGVAEISARRKSDLTPRGVPKVITLSIVVGSLLVIFADWFFSQLLLKRH